MIYLIISLYFVFLSYNFDYRNSSRNYIFHLRLGVLLLVLVAGFRYRLAPDSVTYMNDFMYRTKTLFELTPSYFSNSRYQPLWLMLNSICKTIYNDYVFFQLVCSIIINYSVSYFFKNSSEKYFTCMLFYVFSCYVYFNMEIVREALAVSMVLIALVNYNRGKRGKSLFYLTLAMLFHIYAILTLLVFLFISDKINQRIKNILAFVFVLVLILLPNPIILFAAIMGGGIATNLDFYNSIKVGAMSVGGYLFMFIRILVPSLAIFYYKKKGDISSSFLSHKQLINLSLIFIILVIIRTFSIPYLERVLNYFSLIMIVLMTSYFYELLEEGGKFYRLRFMLYFSIIILFLFFNIYPMLKFIPSWNAPYYKRYFPYESVFDKQKDSQREYIIKFEGKEF